MNNLNSSYFNSLNAVANGVALISTVVQQIAGNEIALPREEDGAIEEMVTAKLQACLASITNV